MRSSATIASIMRTRRALRMSADGLARLRERQWAALQPALQKTPALAAWAGRAPDAFPVVIPADMRRDYGAWNSLGLDHDRLCGAADAAETGSAEGAIEGLGVGWSTGTSGSRGLFIANAAERADYIGQSLARLLPLGAMLRPQRIALHLRANSNLYSDVGGRFFSFAHFPLSLPTSETRDKLAEFAPTILIAPPHHLLALADLWQRSDVERTGPRHIFFGSEPMSAAEIEWVNEAVGVRPRSIYQATEGFLGAACLEGALHLNEHSLAVELEPVDGTKGYRPVITDLRHYSQPVVRVRLDDYIEPTGETCRCGYAGRVVRPVAGRVGDIWRWGTLAVTPDAVANCVDSVVGVPAAWQAIGTARGVELRVDPKCPAGRASDAAGLLQDRLGIPVPVTLSPEPPAVSFPKRRRVMWHG
ncbi:putative adenylate-forming enzyme [Sphingopyxis panaciterrae]|uniref:cell division protein FtsA n=1 Tax=Sphingopyxis panaciterrae TaxID=363841 RepID=UPI001422533D|nr:cell division protein FtsA [Sphingopyxis panaciterrae]NIJ37146.1 putative adenylate-forming enzyme [Sphingopyxis panaciterrae]